MARQSKPAKPATCLHCSGTCRLTNGVEVYPHRPDLYDHPIYVCDPCGARVKCHPGGTQPLGYAADEKTRDARIKLHNLRLDPLWKKAPGDREAKKAARRHTYKFLAQALGIDPKECHTGMFTIERCRDAWRALRGHGPLPMTERDMSSEHLRPMTFEQTEALGQYDFSKDFDPSELEFDECMAALSALDEQRDQIKAGLEKRLEKIKAMKTAFAYRNRYRQRILDRLGVIREQGKKQRIAIAENEDREDALAFVRKARAVLGNDQYLPTFHWMWLSNAGACPMSSPRRASATPRSQGIS